MDSVLVALKDTPIPTILVLAGITFLLLAIVSQLVSRTTMAPKRKRWAVIIGGGLLVIGLALYVVPPLSEPRSPTSPETFHQLPVPDAPTSSPPSKPRPRPSPPTSPQLAAIDRILATLPLANIAFNTPATLRLGHSAVIQLFLSMQHSIEQLQATISAVGEKEGARIRVSDQMEARLSGAGFKIEAITPEIQAVSERDITEWKWEIEPTRVGS